MRTTSRGHSLDLSDSLPHRSNNASWDHLTSYDNEEGGGSLVGDGVPAGTRTGRNAVTYNHSKVASPANGHAYSSAPWLTEGDTNIWGHGEHLGKPDCRLYLLGTLIRLLEGIHAIVLEVLSARAS